MFLNFEISSSRLCLLQYLFDNNQNYILKGPVSASDLSFASHLSQMTERSSCALLTDLSALHLFGTWDFLIGYLMQTLGQVVWEELGSVLEELGCVLVRVLDVGLLFEDCAKAWGICVQGEQLL